MRNKQSRRNSKTAIWFVVACAMVSLCWPSSNVSHALELKYNPSPNTSHARRATASTATVTISGAAEVGKTLIAKLVDPKGVPVSDKTRRYQWLANGTEIKGASYFSYKLTSAEVGKRITVRITFVRNNLTAESIISPATKPVAWSNSPGNKIGSIYIKGINRVGHTFVAEITDPDGVPNNGITYEWYEFYGKFLGTGKTFTQKKEHIGMQVLVQAKYTDKKAHQENITSSFSGSVVSDTSGGTGSGITKPAAGTPRITLSGPTSIREGQTAVYTATLDKVASKDVSADIKINYTSSDSTDALIRWDSQRVVIKAGSKSAQFYVDTVADNKREGNESYRISISNAVTGNINNANVKPITSKVTAQSVFMLSYVYPLAKAGGTEFSDYWKAVHAAGSSKIPYVMIMADASPDAILDPGYVRVLKKNVEMGFKNIAYIRTIQQTRPISEVKAAMAKLIKLYGSDKIQGFYFDEISSRNNAAVSYLAELYNYVKTTYGHKIVFANPGAHITDSIAPYADVFMTNEGSANDYINNYKAATSEFENNPANSHRIFHTIYGANANNYQQIINLSRSRNAGFVYITTDSTYPDGRPYNDLPSNFPWLINTINNLKRPADPNRGSILPVLSGATIGNSSVTTTILDQ